MTGKFIAQYESRNIKPEGSNTMPRIILRFQTSSFQHLRKIFDSSHRIETKYYCQHGFLYCHRSLSWPWGELIVPFQTFSIVGSQVLALLRPDCWDYHLNSMLLSRHSRVTLLTLWLGLWETKLQQRSNWQTTTSRMFESFRETLAILTC